MNPRRTAVAVGCSLVLVGLPLSASSAVAAGDTTKPSIKSASAAKEVYALKPRTAQDVVITVRVTDNVGVSKAWAKLYAPGKSAPTYTLSLTRVSGTAKDGTWQASSAVKLPVALGKWSVRAAARDAAGNSTGNSSVLDTFSLKRHVEMGSWQARRACTDDCTREVKGKVGVAVTLADAGTKEYRSLSGQVVHIEFRKKGSTTWTKLGPPAGVDGGIYYGTMKSPGDGDWRARYYGTSTLAGNVTKPIYVDTL